MASLWIRYLLAVCDVQFAQVYDTITAHAPSTKDTVMTLAQRLMEEGKVQGRAEGRVEELQEILRLLLINRFGTLPGWVEPRITAARIEQLRDWVSAIFHAQSLEDMFEQRH